MAAMQQRAFGHSDVTASVIGFGAWTLGTEWWGEVADEPALALIRKAVDLGITFFDTGDVYGDGRSEELVGQALQPVRDQVTIGTKFGYDLAAARPAGHSERPQDFSPAACRRALEASLRRLGTDHVDLYELHNARIDDVRRDDLFAELESLRKEGKVRAIGVALGPAIGWKEEGLAAIERGVDAVQTVYNLLEQEPGRTFAEAARQSGGRTALISRVPHATDVLTGTTTLETTYPEGDHRNFRNRTMLADLFAKVKTVDFLAETRTLAQAALAFVVAQPAFTTVLPTLTTIRELEEYAASVDHPLSDEELARIEELRMANFHHIDAYVG
jgi:aryl-alcohol dehydrogenase-like predicted oxidoreductase